MALPSRPEILTGDAGDGGSEFVGALPDRGIDPHVPLLAKEEGEELPSWKRRIFDLERARAGEQKVKEVRPRLAFGRSTRLEGIRSAESSKFGASTCSPKPRTNRDSAEPDDEAWNGWMIPAN